MAKRIRTKMEKLTENIMERAANAFDLPTDALAGLPRIEIVGLRRMLIENHKGIVEYGDREIAVSGGGAVLKIKGEGLRLLAMTQNEMLIGGNIFNVEIMY